MSGGGELEGMHFCLCMHVSVTSLDLTVGQFPAKHSSFNKPSAVQPHSATLTLRNVLTFHFL